MRKRGRQIQLKETAGGCIEVVSHKLDASGYSKLHINGKRVRYHRHVYETMFGFLKEGQVVRHSCDNAACCNPEHLLAGTQLDNIQDRQDRNRQAIGEKIGGCILKESAVLEIIGLFGKLSDKEIAKRYNCDRRTIYDIRNGHTWNHVSGFEKTKGGKDHV